MAKKDMFSEILQAVLHQIRNSGLSGPTWQMACRGIEKTGKKWRHTRHPNRKRKGRCMTTAPTIDFPTPKLFPTDQQQSHAASYQSAFATCFLTVNVVLILVSLSWKGWSELGTQIQIQNFQMQKTTFIIPTQHYNAISPISACFLGSKAVLHRLQLLHERHHELFFAMSLNNLSSQLQNFGFNCKSTKGSIAENMSKHTTELLVYSRSVHTTSYCVVSQCAVDSHPALLFTNCVGNPIVHLLIAKLNSAFPSAPKNASTRWQKV